MSVPRPAHRDPSLSARVLTRAPLFFSGGADATSDRSAHVRAGSSLAQLSRGMVVIQDDSNFLALIDPSRPAASEAIPLPAGPDGRRQFGDSGASKHLKLDLEACVAVAAPAPLFIAFGSGSTPARESIVIVSGWDGDIIARVVAAPAMYASLRDATSFSGSQMNIEGAVMVGDRLRFFGRGNGAGVGELRPVNATCELPWAKLFDHLMSPDDFPAPRPSHVQQFALGELGGVPLGFTDGAAWRGGVLFSAAAEDAPDAVRDGPVSGSVIGVIDESAVRWAPITDQEGAIIREKAEGLLVADAEANELWVVADADDESRPSELWRVRLEGPWQSCG